jgi:CheY-like chemotaxis protein
LERVATIKRRSVAHRCSTGLTAMKNSSPAWPGSLWKTRLRSSLLCERTSKPGNAVALSRSAHTLRGSLANVGAEHAASLAAEIEERARKDLLEGADGRMVELSYEVDSILAELGRSRATTAASPASAETRLGQLSEGSLAFGRKVVVAEDDPVSREILTSLLKKWGYDVIAAADGREAMEALRSQTDPVLAVLDWMMPGMDGPEICRRVREINKSAYILLVTARTVKNRWSRDLPRALTIT